VSCYGTAAYLTDRGAYQISFTNAADCTRAVFRRPSPHEPGDESDYIAFFVVLQPGRRPAVETHTEHQSVLCSTSLISVSDFLAEVRRAQQFHFRPLHEVTNVVNVLSLEAVRTAHGELQLVHGTQQDRIELHLGDLRGGLLLALQIDEH